MDPFELLQVSMVEEDKPIELDNGEYPENITNDETEITPDKYPSLTISHEEFECYQSSLGDIEYVRYKKLHCTACNVHMGSAPIAENHRFEHPLLKVLICEHCYNFYTSGDFEKDADGSELYCRWCGQGGQVYCCAKCPFVFCKKCIQRNIGRSMVNHIDSSDDWLCYACNPRDIWPLRCLNWALREYSNLKNSIRISDRTPQDNQDIITDYSLCCKERLAGTKQKGGSAKKTSTTSNANSESSRKSIEVDQNKSFPKGVLVPRVERLQLESVAGSQGTVYQIKNNSAPKKKPSPPAPQVTAAENELKSAAEVVCTPDIIALDDESPPPSPSVPEPIVNEEPIVTVQPIQKKFLQVKPASKLIDPTLSQPQKAIEQRTIEFKTIQDASFPANFNIQTFQNNPAVASVIHNLQKSIRPGDTQKIIKIVSPDGRAFYIDPLKLTPVTTVPQANDVHTVNSTIQWNKTPMNPPPLQMINRTNATAQIIIQTPKRTIEQPQPVRETTNQKNHFNARPKWIHKSIVQLQGVSKHVTNIITNVVNDKELIATSQWTTLYNNIQTNLKTLTDHVDKLKLDLKNEFLESVKTPEFQMVQAMTKTPQDGFGQHFLSLGNPLTPDLVPVDVVKESPILSSLMCATQPLPALTKIQNTVNHVEQVENNDSEAPKADETILTPPSPSKVAETENDENEDETIDPKSLLEQSLEEGTNEVVTSGASEEYDESRIKKLKKHLQKIKKQIAAKQDKIQTVALNDSNPDEIFDMDVTCETDNEEISDTASVDSVYSVRSSESDSDCVVVSDSESAKKRKSPRKSRSRSVSLPPETGQEDEVQDNNDKNDEGERPEEENKMDDEDEDEQPEKIESEEKEGQEEVEEENSEGKEENNKKRKLSSDDDVPSPPSKICKTAEDVDVTDAKQSEENDEQQSDENTSKEDPSQNNLGDDETKTSSNNSLEETKSNTEDNDESKSQTNSPEKDMSIFFNDLVSIANAIRESIKESHDFNKVKKKKKTKSGDLEKLLSSNVVFKKSTEGDNTAQMSEKSSAGGTSFVDAFSNFVATSTNETEIYDDELEETTGEQSSGLDPTKSDDEENGGGGSENAADNEEWEKEGERNAQLNNGNIVEETTENGDKSVDDKKENSHSIKETILTEDSSAHFESTFSDNNTNNFTNNLSKENVVDLETEMAVLQKLAENCIAESVNENSSSITTE